MYILIIKPRRRQRLRELWSDKETKRTLVKILERVSLPTINIHKNLRSILFIVNEISTAVQLKENIHIKKRNQ